MFMKKVLFLLLTVFLSRVAVASDKNENENKGVALPDQLMLADPFILEHDGWYYFIKSDKAAI